MARLFNTEAGARRYDRLNNREPCEVCGASASSRVAWMEVTPGPKPRPVGTCGSRYCRDRAVRGDL